MTTFTNILVSINPVDGEHPALEQAAELAARMKARMTLVDVLPDVPDKARRFVTNQIEQELIDHRWELLKGIAGAYGKDVKTALLRGSAPSIALVREVMRGGHDLLVRSHGTAGQKPKRYGPVDMQLLRKCPCPVWLVGPGSRPKPRKILAAIDAGCNDPGEADLNQAILDLALTIRDLEGSHLTVIYVWSAFGYEFLQRRTSAKEFDAFMEAARAAAQHDLDRFVEALGPKRAGIGVELAEGAAHEVLERFCESHGIDLVVMGSVARTGLAGFIMGNTAERILAHLRGSVVAIKPAGFVSPVSPDAT